MTAQPVTADAIRALVARVDEDPAASTKRTSHTLQTRRVAAAMRALGLKRGQYTARVHRERQRGVTVYGDAIANPTRPSEDAHLIETNAQALADAGFAVHLLGQHSHFIGSSSRGYIVDHRQLDAAGQPKRTQGQEA